MISFRVHQKSYTPLNLTNGGVFRLRKKTGHAFKAVQTKSSILSTVGSLAYGQGTNREPKNTKTCIHGPRLLEQNHHLLALLANNDLPHTRPTPTIAPSLPYPREAPQTQSPTPSI